MLISSVLFYEVARRRWGWSRWAAGVPVAGFLVLDISFFSANISKILHGAWFPLAIGALVFALMVSWKQGRSQLAERMKASAVTFDQFQAMITENPPTRVSGKAVFLTGKPDIVPAALLHNLAHNKILHTEVMILNFATETVPRVPNDRKVEVSKLGGGLFRVVAHYGFMEEFNIPNILSLVREQGLDFRMEDLSFFLGRLRLSVEETSPLGRLQRRIFAFMARNAGEAAGFFGVPSEQVIEVGVDLRL